MTKTNSTPSRAHFVYRIVCFATGKVYIGFTNDLLVRKRGHFYALNNNNHINKGMQSDYNKYPQSFFFEVLEKGVCIQDVVERERYWINHFDSFRKGYNRTRGGQTNFSPSNAVECSWNGIKYKTVTACAQANGIDRKSMEERLAKGFSHDRDVLITSTGQPVTWNGVRYESITDAAKANAITSGAMKMRLLTGYTCDADMQRQYRQQYTWNGIVYPDIKKAAAANGISDKAMHFRLKQGYTSDADMPGTASARAKSCVWNGIQYKTQTAAALSAGVALSTMRYYIKKGYTCDADIRR